MVNRTLGSALVIAAALALSACTGEDDRPDLSSQEFARAASAVCAKFVRSTADAVDPQTDDLAANAAYLDEIIPALETLVRELRVLRPHESIAAKTDSLVRRYDEMLEAEREMRDAATRGDLAGFGDAFGRVIPLAYETTNRATRLGREVRGRTRVRPASRPRRPSASRGGGVGS